MMLILIYRTLLKNTRQHYNSTIVYKKYTDVFLRLRWRESGTVIGKIRAEGRFTGQFRQLQRRDVNSELRRDCVISLERIIIKVVILIIIIITTTYITRITSGFYIFSTLEARPSLVTEFPHRPRRRDDYNIV